MFAIRNVAENLKDDLARILIEEATEAVSIARTLVPVKTGRLQDSIGIVSWSPEELQIIAGASAPYAGFVEFGTVKMHARPFWRPPIWEAFYRIRERIHQRIRDRWKGVY